MKGVHWIPGNLCKYECIFTFLTEDILFRTRMCFSIIHYKKTIIINEYLYTENVFLLIANYKISKEEHQKWVLLINSEHAGSIHSNLRTS